MMIQLTFVGTTADRTILDYDSVIINTFVEEDGELKILSNKDFSDPQKRANVHNWVARALGKKPSDL
jgi:hypothetical protein